MIDGIDIIKYNLIVNFILFVLIIVFAFLAFTAEKDNNSLRYSSEKEDRFCYADIMCKEPSSNQNSQVTFSVTDYSSSLNDQNIVFQYYNSSGGLSEQIFNIYLGTSALPTNTVTYHGLCAGYINYSSSGTSIYLYHFYDQNGTSWNDSEIAGLMEQAFIGTSGYIENLNNLTNNNDQFLTYNLQNTLSGLSVFSSQQGPSSLISTNNNNILAVAPIAGQLSEPNDKNMMNNYKTTLKITKFSNENPTGISHRRCIDPSFASNNHCVDLAYNHFDKLYISKKLPIQSGYPICTSEQTATNDNCGVPFCYNGSVDKGNYQINRFDTTGEVKNTLGGSNNINNYQYKGKSVNKIYNSGTTFDDFSSAPQAQNLLFCGGTSTTKNNITDTDFTTEKGRYPIDKPSKSTNPNIATQPNQPIIKGNKVILGFK